MVNDQEKLFKRLYEKTRKTKKGCVLWMKGTNSGGYGQLNVDRKIKQAHRLSYELKNGPIPPGLLVCHKCDVRRCINPDHLFLGTYRDNTQDCINKGRAKKNSKLTKAKVKKIRELYNTGQWTHRSLADKFKMSKAAIWDILNHNHWVQPEIKIKIHYNRKRNKITFQKANELREKYKTGNFSQRILAIQYGISQQTVSEIITFKIWNNS